jgi:hypothetical protein
LEDAPIIEHIKHDRDVPKGLRETRKENIEVWLWWLGALAGTIVYLLYFRYLGSVHMHDVIACAPSHTASTLCPWSNVTDHVFAHPSTSLIVTGMRRWKHEQSIIWSPDLLPALEWSNETETWWDLILDPSFHQSDAPPHSEFSPKDVENVMRIAKQTEERWIFHAYHYVHMYFWVVVVLIMWVVWGVGEVAYWTLYTFLFDGWWLIHVPRFIKKSNHIEWATYIYSGASDTIVDNVMDSIAVWRYTSTAWEHFFGYVKFSFQRGVRSMNTARLELKRSSRWDHRLRAWVWTPGIRWALRGFTVFQVVLFLSGFVYIIFILSTAPRVSPEAWGVFSEIWFHEGMSGVMMFVELICVLMLQILLLSFQPQLNSAVAVYSKQLMREGELDACTSRTLGRIQRF